MKSHDLCEFAWVCTESFWGGWEKCYGVCKSRSDLRVFPAPCPNDVRRDLLDDLSKSPKSIEWLRGRKSAELSGNLLSWLSSSTHLALVTIRASLGFKSLFLGLRMLQDVTMTPRIGCIKAHENVTKH